MYRVNINFKIDINESNRENAINKAFSMIKENPHKLGYKIEVMDNKRRK